ncbi:PIG-X [Schizophyllum commune]
MDAPIGTYESWLSRDHGYHPTFKTLAKLEDPSRYADCTLNLHFLLPPTIFADRYELQNYAPRLQYAYRGPSNLELPVFALDTEEGPELLVSIVLDGERKEGPIEVDVPLHLRYGPVSGPDASNTHEDVLFPHPSAFLACPKSQGPSHCRLETSPMR